MQTAILVVAGELVSIIAKSSVESAVPRSVSRRDVSRRAPTTAVIHHVSVAVVVQLLETAMLARMLTMVVNVSRSVHLKVVKDLHTAQRVTTIVRTTFLSSMVFVLKLALLVI